jgi:putative FmdB family regulatory protein
MPLYEYECETCAHRFERIQKFSDPLIDTCPVCEGPVRKLLSSPAIQFKGSGWYITDYAKKGAGGDSSTKADGGEKKAESAEKPDSGSGKPADKPVEKAEKPSSAPSSSAKTD